MGYAFFAVTKWWGQCARRANHLSGLLHSNPAVVLLNYGDIAETASTMVLIQQKRYAEMLLG
jgi:hypothetical protein